MGQKKNAAAKRGAKKHEKAKKRQKRMAQRAAPPRPSQRPEDAWRPAREGIEGLTLRTGFDPHRAAHMAEHLWSGHHRLDIQGCWLPGRVSAMTTEALLAALAARGVVTDQERYSALAEPSRSSTALAEQAWIPLLPPEQTPHDRDLLRAAAHVLWQRWRPDLLSDEEIFDTLYASDGATLHGHGDAPVDLSLLLGLWDRLRSRGGLARLESATRTRFCNLLCDGVEVAQDDPQVGIPALLEILAQLPDDSEHRFVLEGAVWDSTDDDALHDALLDADLAAGERDPTSLRGLIAADLVLSAEHPTPAQVARALAGVTSTLARIEAHPDRHTPALVDLEDALQYQRAGLLKLQESGAAQAG